MHTRVFAITALALLLLAALPAKAAADVRLTPFGGVSRLYDDNRSTYGVTLALGGLIGFEFDAARINLETVDVDFFRLEADAVTYMGNMFVRFPAGPIQPYGTVGIGVIRVTGDINVPGLVNVADVSGRDFSWNLGGGVYIIPSRHIGVRADFRHFRTGDVSFDDILNIVDGDLPLPNVDFWRSTVGLTIRF